MRQKDVMKASCFELLELVEASELFPYVRCDQEGRYIEVILRRGRMWNTGKVVAKSSQATFVQAIRSACGRLPGDYFR